MAINSTDPKDTGYITASIEDVINAFQSSRKYWGVYGVKISEQQATEAKGRIEPHDPIDKNGEHTAIASELLERVRVAVGGEYSGNVFCVSHTLIARQKGEYVQFYFRQPFSDDGWEQWDKLMKNERVAYRK